MELKVNRGEVANAKILGISNERYSELMQKTAYIFANMIGERPLMVMFSHIAEICDNLEEYTAMVTYATINLWQKGSITSTTAGEIYN